MRIFRPATYFFGVLAAIALLGGCSSSGGPQSSGLTPISGTNSADQASDDTFVGLKWTGNVHPDHQKSWVSPELAKTSRVFFESDVSTNDVYIFRLPDLKLEGTLTGFNKPQGECSDKHGNVYIANTKAYQVREYSHTGQLLNTYSDTYGNPVGCAVNPVNGNLAVTNIHGLHGAAGQVLIYAGPTSTPKILANPKQYYYYFAGYAPHGELWVDGKNAKGAYMVSNCGFSNPVCGTIKLRSGKIHSPGSVQFDRFEQAWVLFDQGPCASGGPCSYWVYARLRYKLSEPNNYETYNGGPACDLIQVEIRNVGHPTQFVAGGDNESACGNVSTTTDRWPYTAELNAMPTDYTTKYVTTPVGAAVSYVKK